MQWCFVDPGRADAFTHECPDPVGIIATIRQQLAVYELGGTNMVKPSGSEASAFAVFAILDELIRTLHSEGVLENLDVVGLLQRAKTSVADVKSIPAPEAVEIIKEMLREYGQ
jgi:hypothetical protein